MKYKILYLPTGDYVTNDFNNKPAVFLKEELAYRALIQKNISTGHEKNVQLLLLCSELEKKYPGFIQEAFLDKDINSGKDIYIGKSYSFTSLFCYFNRGGIKKRKLYKEVFKVYCDTVLSKGLGKFKTQMCFEHFSIEAEE